MNDEQKELLLKAVESLRAAIRKYTDNELKSRTYRCWDGGSKVERSITCPVCVYKINVS